jgi:hypothetical protein
MTVNLYKIQLKVNGIWRDLDEYRRLNYGQAQENLRTLRSINRGLGNKYRVRVEYQIKVSDK